VATQLQVMWVDVGIAAARTSPGWPPRFNGMDQNATRTTGINAATTAPVNWRAKEYEVWFMDGPWELKLSMY